MATIRQCAKCKTVMRTPEALCSCDWMAQIADTIRASRPDLWDWTKPLTAAVVREATGLEFIDDATPITSDLVSQIKAAVHARTTMSVPSKLHPAFAYEPEGPLSVCPCCGEDPGDRHETRIACQKCWSQHNAAALAQDRYMASSVSGRRRWYFNKGTDLRVAAMGVTVSRVQGPVGRVAPVQATVSYQRPPPQTPAVEWTLTVPNANPHRGGHIVEGAEAVALALAERDFRTHPALLKELSRQLDGKAFTMKDGSLAVERKNPHDGKSYYDAVPGGLEKAKGHEPALWGRCLARARRIIGLE